MKKIGLTGGIGSGKTYVSSILKAMGFPVFSSDESAKSLMQYDPEIKKELIKIFGPTVYINGELNSVFLASGLFSDDALRVQINALIHPAVRRDFDQWTKKQNQLLVFNEAAILCETGAYVEFDACILVSAPDEIKIKRIMERNSCSRADAEARMAAQWSDVEKRKCCDYEIINSGDRPLLIQVEQIMDSLLKN